jgi:ClpX C4-type zinc finger
MNRRRFIAFIGAAVPGLWVDGVGLIQLPRQMVITISGQCSFCGKDARKVFGLAGVLSRHARICNECIDICLEILMDDVQLVLAYAVDSRPDPLLKSSESIDAFDFEASLIWRNDDMRRISVDQEAFMEKIWKHFDQSKPLDHPQPLDHSRLACSFCARNQNEAKKLIAGPQTYICEICIGDAAALIKMHS